MSCNALGECTGCHKVGRVYTRKRFCRACAPWCVSERCRICRQPSPTYVCAGCRILASMSSLGYACRPPLAIRDELVAYYEARASAGLDLFARPISA